MSSYFLLQARCCATQSHVESHIQTTTHTISSRHLIWVPCRTTVGSPGLLQREKERHFQTAAQSIDACLKGHLVNTVKLQYSSQLGTPLICTIYVWNLIIYNSGGSVQPSHQNRQLDRELPWIQAASCTKYASLPWLRKLIYPGF